MRKNKVGSIFLVSMLALAGLGISYAGFSDIIYVSGTVETAELSLTVIGYSGTWAWKSITENDPHGLVVTDNPDYEPPTGDTGFKVASAFAREGGADEADVVFVFDNLFPCIDFKADFKFQYTGTIPARLWADIEYEVPEGEDWVAALLLVPGGVTFEAWNVTNPAEPIPIDIGYQVHGDEIIEIWITIHIPQDNYYQGRSATFSAWVGALQWNEDPLTHTW